MSSTVKTPHIFHCNSIFFVITAPTSTFFHNIKLIVLTCSLSYSSKKSPIASLSIGTNSSQSKTGTSSIIKL